MRCDRPDARKALTIPALWRVSSPMTRPVNRLASRWPIVDSADRRRADRTQKFSLVLGHQANVACTPQEGLIFRHDLHIMFGALLKKIHPNMKCSYLLFVEINFHATQNIG